MTKLSIRVATYNMRRAIGTDRRRDPERILRIIARLEADIVALQETDRRLPPRRPVLDRNAILSQTGLVPIAFDHDRESLGWHGNAILVRSDIVVADRAHHDLPGLEPRGAVEAVLQIGDVKVRVIGLHLGLLRVSRRGQLARLLETFAQPIELPTILLGDFNERSLKIGLGRLARRFSILQGGPTFHSRRPLFPLDRVAISDDVRANRVAVAAFPEAHNGSDHLPLLADLTIGVQPSSPASGPGSRF